MPLCVVEHVVEKLDDVCVTVTLVSQAQMLPTTLEPLRQDLTIRHVASWGVLSQEIADFILQPARQEVLL